MATLDDSIQDDNLYFVDHESGAEMARLLDQDRLFTKGMGGLFSERSNDFSGMRRILDLGCGPGGWVQEVAFANPDIEVVGIDLSHSMIEYARAQARVQGLNNARFEIMDMTGPLGFPDGYFDLVNARLIAFLTPATWPKFLSECLRVIRPGGIYRETETEFSISNSKALERLEAIFKRALWAAGKSFSPEGMHMGITPMLGQLLRDAGCQNTGLQVHAIDYSAGTSYHEGFCQDWRASYKLTQPFFVRTKVATQKELDQLYEQMVLDTYSDNFRAVYLLLTSWGEKSGAR